jgi:hypothetical protein
LFDLSDRCSPAAGRNEAEELPSKWINSDVPNDGGSNFPGSAAVRTSKCRCGFG